MSFVPTICDACCRVSLLGLHEFSRDTPSCTRCNQELRVIPSRSYAETDVELFDELSETVAHSVSRLDAQRLAQDIDGRLMAGSVTKAFDALVVRWPALLPVRLATGANVKRQQRILQIFKTIFEALAMTRQSGTIWVVRASKPSRYHPASAGDSGA